ncbi:DUF4079 domain-containing protein [Geitlerinema sp. P-1104]|uniref:DUF4079 domain-containing protein n=1 Tax=Geitlerinema sp. P-1104 TaxID=2546230 RepID=UPI0014775C26|nr:DUF4079 domain-containing protein [Geitlerinema sp. P-1104]NMG59167.1 DUF4079 domain-containing protein [Geitlerinema sp. P-1104]
MDFIPESIKPWLNFIHPLLMWGMLAIAIYALYTGLKVRKLRSASGEEKKELVQGDFRSKHFKIGSLLLVGVVLGAIGGMSVTYINNGKLFVGPHLLVGLSMMGLVALSASLAPLMQRGKDWARYSHISLNIAVVGLFAWQAVTGMNIVQRILENF